ncbi:MAG: ABC transporter permease subunit [Pirellulales bacterium]|nr:ABC transporter permease subunit [Pirellulales bacterium]
MGSFASDLVLLGAISTWLKPLWVVAAGAAGVIAALLVVALALRLLAPKVAAIARTTAKEALGQPLFYVLLVIGVVALLIFPFVPYNTFGEDVKMVKAEGLTLIKVLAIVLALWTASISISEEIEGKTALTLLSKPIGRRQLLLGKFLGILVPVVVVFVILGSLFLGSISFKTVYDARENSQAEPTSAQCLEEMVQITPGLALAFLEAVVLTSVSVAISTRLPMLANLMICASIYVLGHLVPLLVNSAVGRFEIVGFVGRLLSAVLPVLDHFSIETAISTGQAVPGEYLAWATVYALLYSAVALLVGLLMFEDRDLA